MILGGWTGRGDRGTGFVLGVGCVGEGRGGGGNCSIRMSSTTFSDLLLIVAGFIRFVIEYSTSTGSWSSFSRFSVVVSKLIVVLSIGIVVLQFFQLLFSLACFSFH